MANLKIAASNKNEPSTLPRFAIDSWISSHVTKIKIAKAIKVKAVIILRHLCFIFSATDYNYTLNKEIIRNLKDQRWIELDYHFY